MLDVTFTGAPPATVEAADPGTEARRISGVAVPWDAVGTVADGTRVRFARGALDASARPIVLRGHDGPPIGMTVDAADTETGMSTTVRVSRVRDGDEALILAADGVLGMFSVGVNPDAYHYDDDGVMVVESGEWHHTALLPFGAFAAARVTDVAASQPPPPNLETAMPDTAEPVTVDTAPPAPVTQAAPAIIPVHGPTPPPEPLTLPRVAQIISAGMTGRIGAAGIRAQIEAALTNVTTTNVPGLVRPGYSAELSGMIDHGMPLVRALQNRPLPASGMKIEYPRWGAAPDSTAIQATEKTAIASGDVTISVQSVDIETWAQGNDISFQAAQRSDPSFIDAYLRACAIDAADKYDAHVATALLAVATAGTPGTDFVSNVQALFAALNPTSTPAGPLFLAVSNDILVDMVGVTGLNGPAFWNASIDLGSSPADGSAGGLLMFRDKNLGAGTMLLGSRNGAATYGGPDSLTDVRVVDVSLLGIDIGVYFYAALAIEYAGAFAKLSGITTFAAPASSSSKK